jgi:hypothetical protein
MTRHLIFILTFVLPAIANTNPFVVHNGKSAYVIHHAEDSPESVKEAAKELQRVVRESTDCTLQIRTVPASLMICVGDCAAARAAGLSGNGMADETFRIATIGENLYIVGRDTPDGQRTQLGGISHGTRHGVYLFLERVIGARWIMPNSLGEIVPRHESLPLPNLDITDGPAFAYRALEITSPPQVRLWAQRNRIGVRQDGESGSLEMRFGHRWNQSQLRVSVGCGDRHRHFGPRSGQIGHTDRHRFAAGGQSACEDRTARTRSSVACQFTGEANDEHDETRQHFHPGRRSIGATR